MNINELKRLIDSQEQSIVALNALKSYINYLIQNENDQQVEKFLNKAIKLASDLQLPREEGALLIELGVYYWNKLDYKSALNMFRLSCGIFKQSNNDYDLVVATKNVGETYTKIGDYNNAISFLKLSLDFLEKLKEKGTKEVDDLQGDINNSLGTAYRKCKSYALSMSTYFKALELQERHGLVHKRCQTNLNIGKMFVDIGNFERALKYFNKVVELSIGTNDLPIKSQAYALIGRLYRKNDKCSQALSFYQEALIFLQEMEHKNNYNRIKILYELALTYKELQNYDKVIELCESGIKELSGNDYSLYKGKIKYLYGTALGFKQNYELAEKMFMSALEDIAPKDTANSLKYKILQALSAIYAQQDDYPKAYQTLIKSNSYIDLMIQEKKDKALLELEAKFESQQKVREEIMLKKASQEVVDLKEQVNNLSLLIDDYQDIDRFFGVISKDNILEAINRQKEIHSQNGVSLTTLRIKLVADKEVAPKLTYRIISDISKLIMFYTRNQDEIGRWGDDSLVLILAGMKAEAVDTVIDKIELPIYNDILKKEKDAKFKIEFEIID